LTQTRPFFFCRPDLSGHPPNPPALGEALKEVDQAIEKEFQAFPNTLQSIKRIGPVYSTGIFSEVGDIHRFPTEDALAKFAGLTWKRYQSGNFETEETHMSKTGNGYLRYYLIEASNAFRVHNAEYQAYYETKFQKVTKHQHKRALALTARKLVRLVFALLKKRPALQRKLPSGSLDGLFGFQRANWLTFIFKKNDH